VKFRTVVGSVAVALVVVAAFAQSQPPPTLPGHEQAGKPLSTVPPEYPPRALNRGLAGWVRVTFDIAEDGTVRNARATVSSNKVFEAAAVASVARWRYPRPTENGLATTCKDVETDVKFALSVERSAL
jgi:protein TonB